MKNNFLKQFYLRHRLIIFSFVSFLLIIFFSSSTVSTIYAIGNCSTGGVNDASCINGNVQNLNFGITNSIPWYQSFCGDIRQDGGYDNSVPASPVCGGTSLQQYTIATNATCTNNSAVYFSGNSTSTYGATGQVSTKNWIAGGNNTNPENFKPINPGVIRTSYNYMLTTAKQSGLTPTELDDGTPGRICTLSNCSLPSNLQHGLYHANRDVILTTSDYSFSANQSYVFLINGNLTLKGKIHVPVGSAVIFSVLKNITVDSSVGEALSSSTVSDIEGFYSTDQSFIIASAASCPSNISDNRLNIAGAVIVNAGLQGGSFQNNRDLCGQNLSCPAVSFTERLDLVLNAPVFIKHTQSLFQEVAP